MLQKDLTEKLFEKGKVFNFSNGLSFIRLIGAFVLYYLTAQHMISYALWLTLLLVWTDYADGYFARKLNQISEMGKVLDPLADKACGILTFLALYQYHDLPFWILAIVIGRDALIVLGSFVLASKLPYITPSAMVGKITVTLAASLYLVYLVSYDPLKTPMLIITAIAIVASFLYYIVVFYQKMTTPEEETHDNA